MNFRRFTLACLLGLGSAAAASATNLNSDVSQFAAGVRNYNLITFGDATFTSASDLQEGLACNGLLTVDGNTFMSGGGVNYVDDGDPSFYVSGTLKLNGGYTKINSGYASTPSLSGQGYTFANKQLNTPPPGNGTLDSTNSNNARTTTNPINNPAPANWNWSTLQSTMRAVSSDLASAPITGTISVSSQNLVLTTSVTSGVAVFQLDMSKFNGSNYNGQHLSNVSISVPAGVDYVINVINASGQVVWPASVNMNSGTNNGQLLWNFSGCTGQITLGGGQFFGSILAPDAYVFTTNTIPVGQVVCQTFRNNSAELHYISFAAKQGTVPTITSSSTASGYCGQPLNYGTTATGNPTSYSASGLPPGVTCSPSTGALSGTPTAGGVFPVTISASNSNGTGTGTVTITIKYPLTVTASPAAAGTVVGSGWYASGTGVSIVAVPATDYAFAGWTGTGIANPAAATTTDTVTAAQTAVASFAMIPPAITSALTANDSVGGSSTYTITASHHPTSYSASNLPPGLTVNTATGVISGTPTTAGSYPVTIGATNAGGTGTATLTITVVQMYTLTITSAGGGAFTGAGSYAAGSVVNISEGAAAGYRTSGWTGPGVGMVARPSSASTTVTLTADCSLVANFVSQAVLTVSTGPGGNATGGGTFDVGSTPAISATPASDYVFVGWTGANVASPSSAATTVSLAASETVTAGFSMMPPVITSALAIATKLNTGDIYYQTTATHHPTSFAAANLPPGLSMAPSTGIITGTPTAAGTFNTTLSATNAGGTGSATLVFTISQTYTLTITGSPAAGGTVSGQGMYAPGTVVSISETAASGYRTNGWSGPGLTSVADANAATTTVTMNGDLTLQANFVQRAVLTVAAEAGGSASGSGTFDVGTNAPVSAVPDSGYVFIGWSGTGLTDANAASTAVALAGDETVTANFLAVSNPEQLGTIVFPNAIASGQAGVTGTTSANTAVVTNNGTGPETVTHLTTMGDFSASVTLPFTLQPGDSMTIPMTFAPSAVGPRTGVMTGVSSDSTHPVFQFVLEGTGTYPNEPPSATIDAATTGFTGSPFMVASTAFAPLNNLTMHSIEYMSPEGAWTVDVANVTGGNSSRTLGINFPEVGVWTLRAGASTDNGTTWYYSANVQVTVSSGTQSYTLQSMAVPGSGMSLWYGPSPVVSKTYQVQHTNPTTAGGP